MMHGRGKSDLAIQPIESGARVARDRWAHGL
jgi:hypothetical protein